MEEKMTTGKGGRYRSANELLEEHLRKTPETRAEGLKRTAEKYLQKFELYISNNDKYSTDGIERKREVVSEIIEQGNKELKARRYGEAINCYFDVIEKSKFYFWQIERSASNHSLKN